MKKYEYNPFFSPAIDPTFADTARERVRARLAKYGDFLDGPPDEFVAYEVGLDIFADMEKGEFAINFLHAHMQEHWQVSETDEAWNAAVLDMLREAMDHLWKKRSEQKEAEKARIKAEDLARKQLLKQRRAEEEAKKVAKKRIQLWRVRSPRSLTFV